jgi:hypothetical protein
VPANAIGQRKMQLMLMQWWKDATWINDDDSESVIAQKTATISKYGQYLFAFCSYWAEQTKTGRERWQGEKAFDVGRRLSTWANNQDKFNSNSNSNNKSNGNSKANIGTVEQGKSGNTLQSFNPEQVGRAFQDAGFKVVSRETVGGHS